MSHTIYAPKFEETITHQRRESQSHILLRWKVSRIDGASVAIILHVLIAHRILFILDMLIIFSEYRC